MKLKKILAVCILSILSVGLFIPKEIKAKAEENAEEKAKSIVSKMTLEEKVGQVLMPSMGGWNGYPLVNLENEAKDFIKKYNIGGLILFGSNFEDVEQTVKFTSKLHGINKEIPLLLAVDQEGGGATRIAGSTYMPGNLALAAAGDVELTGRVAGAIGEETAAVGIDVNFAPVLDVYTNPTNTVIGTRSFGDNVKIVSDHGEAYVKAMQEKGVSSAAKHFPGNGDSIVDTHADLNINNHDLKTLNEVDMKPFQVAIDAGVDMIMTSHSAYPALDDTKLYSELQGKEVYKSATFSKKIVTDTLKKDMGFDGVVVTDAMDMGALRSYFEPVDATLLALNAGCDIILMPYPIYGKESLADFDKYFNSVVQRIKDGAVSQERLDDAVTRIIKLKIDRGMIGGEEKKLSDIKNKANEVVGSKEHKKLEKEAAEKAVTVIKNEGNKLPMKLKDGKSVVVIDYLVNNVIKKPYGQSAVVEGLEKIKMEQRFQKMTITKAPIIYDVTQKGILLQSTIDELKAAIDKGDYIVFAPYQFDTGAIFAPDMYLPDGAKEIVRDLIDYANEKNKDYVYLNVKDPYDIAYLPNVKNMVACYANVGGDMVSGGEYRRVANVEMGLRGAFGLIDTTGKLPVNIKKANDSNIVYPIGHGLELKKITDGYIYMEESDTDNKISGVNIALGVGIVLLLGVGIFIGKKKEYMGI